MSSRLALHIVVIVVVIVTQLERADAQSCAKQAACFNAQYPCSDCCTKGVNSAGRTCWSGVYTKEACCNPVSTPAVVPPPAVPGVTAPPAQQCAKDPSCFDSVHPCSSCCTKIFISSSCYGYRSIGGSSFTHVKQATVGSTSRARHVGKVGIPKIAAVYRDIYNSCAQLKFPGYPPTASPTMATPSPTRSPTLFPTRSTHAPTNPPTYVYCPTEKPTQPLRASTPVPSAMPTQVPTRKPSLNPSIFPTNRPSLNPTRNPTSKPSLSPTNFVSATKWPTLACITSRLGVPCQIAAGTPVPTPAPSPIPSASPTFTPSFRPTIVPTFSPSLRPTVAPSPAPSIPPTASPTHNPTYTPTFAPTYAPTPAPTFLGGPTGTPSITPTFFPTSPSTRVPTAFPTLTPTRSPTQIPTFAPTNAPSYNPTLNPTSPSTLVPTVAPSSIHPTIATFNPTVSPTYAPTTAPSPYPGTAPPTTTPAPTNTPTPSPTRTPTFSPTQSPSPIPTFTPTTPPTPIPSMSPSLAPSKTPTFNPSLAPNPTPTPTYTTPKPCDRDNQEYCSQSPTTAHPTVNPSQSPSRTPSLFPTTVPTREPTLYPSPNPTNTPSFVPSSLPTHIPSPTPSYLPSTPFPTPVPTQCITFKLPSRDGSTFPPTTTCAADALCFSVEFPCESCCRTGMNNAGKACWDSRYTPQRCCRNSINTPTQPPTQLPTIAPTKQLNICEAITSCMPRLPTGCTLPPTLAMGATASPIAPIVFTPTPVNAVAAGSCQDLRTECPTWAANGDCNGGAAAYVQGQCAKSCKCNEPRQCTTTCVLSTSTTTTAAFRWVAAAYGACSVTCGTGLQTRIVQCFATSSNLRAPDSLCTTAVAGAKPSDTQLCVLSACPSRARSADCQDDLEHCPAWKELGECTKGGEIQKWMETNCKKSCGVCGTPAVVLDAGSASSVSAGCVDHDAQCSKWASLGECNGPSGSFVKNACPRSCKACAVARRGQYAQLQVDSEGDVSLDRADTDAPVQMWPQADSSSSGMVLTANMLVAMLAMALSMVSY